MEIQHTCYTQTKGSQASRYYEHKWFFVVFIGRKFNGDCGVAENFI